MTADISQSRHSHGAAQLNTLLQTSENNFSSSSEKNRGATKIAHVPFSV
jgi:hypothetical protein